MKRIPVIRVNHYAPDGTPAYFGGQLRIMIGKAG